jgi:hypothetical protein
MLSTRILASTLALWGFAAVAADDAREKARELMTDALEKQSELPATPPTLPDQASERARTAHETRAFGKTGEAHKHVREDAKDTARARGLDRAREATAKSNGHADRGLSTADAQRGNADTRSATGRARAEEARDKAPVSPR